MKKLIYIILLHLSLPFSGLAQETIYEIVDVPAEFPGGHDSLKYFLSKKIRFPDDALKKGVNSKCYVKFIVRTDGTIANPKILKGVMDCPECDDEVLRVVSLMPKWTPGQINNQVVSSYYTVPVSFYAMGSENTTIKTSAPKTKKELRQERRAAKRK